MFCICRCISYLLHTNMCVLVACVDIVTGPLTPLAPRFSRLARAAEVWATNIQFPLPCVPWPSHRDISTLDTTTAPPLKRRFWWCFFSDEYIDGSSQRVYLFELRFHRLVMNMPCQNWWPSRWLHLLFQSVPGDCVHCCKNQFFSQQERLKAGFPCCRVCNTNATLWARHCIGRNSMSMCVEIPRQMSEEPKLDSWWQWHCPMNSSNLTLAT